MLHCMADSVSVWALLYELQLSWLSFGLYMRVKIYVHIKIILFVINITKLIRILLPDYCNVYKEQPRLDGVNKTGQDTRHYTGKQ